MARLKLILSCVFLLLGALYGYELSRTSQSLSSPAMTILVHGYIFWGLFWGVPVVWSWWNGISRSFKAESVFGLLLKLCFYFVVPLFGGYLYGVFGGGIYQAVRHALLARSKSGT